MKIVAISDTHGFLPKVPKGEVLIHAGDIGGRTTHLELARFNEWLGTLPHKHKLICPGNHDRICEKEPELAKSVLTNGTLLVDEEITIDGVRFYFSPWTPEFLNWYFMKRRGAHIKKVWEKIPEGIDVLVTHGPPHGVLDECGDIYNPRQKVNVGCKDLLHRVLDVGPKFHVFGHIHEGYGQFKSGKTTYVNASICDGAYKPVNAPIVFEV